MDDLKQLKSVLRSLVVSSPVQMTLTNLLRDYRNMMGCPIPITQYGYRDPLQFLKDRCGDCFLFQGYGTNTVLVPIVPECLKHIDEFVHKQKVSSKMKFKGKRMSINESAIRPPQDLIVKSFESNCRIKTETRNPVRETRNPVRETPRYVRKNPTHAPQRNPLPPECVPPKPNIDKTPSVKHITPNVDNNLNKYKSMSNISENKENSQQDHSLPSKEAFRNFMRSRLPVYESTQDLSNESKSNKDSESGSSQRSSRTLSSTSSTKAIQLEELKEELLQLIKDSPDGVYTVDIMKLYRERYNRELNFSRFGFSSVSALACALRGVFTWRDALGGTRVALAPPGQAAPRPRPRPLPVRAAAAAADAGPADDDALPWIDFDPDVFPADCMSFSESIPGGSLRDVRAGAMLEVMVGEVYSPSQFWMYRLGERHHIAMEEMMDEMTAYYSSGSGAARVLAAGAVRVGHYCSSVYERDWHRSLIVKIVDSETVKVRHVDYGTVERVPAARLKPLRRAWGALPAQALRARLAGVCPAARGRRWPHAAAAAFLRLVEDRRLVANVANVDREENIVELFLIDTSTDRDVRIDLELIRAGHADPRPTIDPTDSDTAEPSYLYPRFGALEAGDTPNFADIHAYLRDGIALEYVEDYSRHVPPALPPAPVAVAPPKPPAPRVLDNRVPLIPRSLVDTAVVAPCVYDSESSSDVEYDKESFDDEQPETQHALNRVESETQTTDQTYTCGDVSSEEELGQAIAPSPAPPPPHAPVPPMRVESAPKLPEVSQENTKPACRAAPRMAPHTRSHPFLSQPLMPAPSMQTLPFFVFPTPAQPLPPLPPFPSYPVHPAFPPRCPPGMEGFCPPQRSYQSPVYPGPAHAPPLFSSVYSSYPEPPHSSAVSHPNSNFSAAPGSRESVFTFTAPVKVSASPASMRPILGNATVSSTHVSRPPASSTPVSRPPVSSVVTASVAPTPIPAGVENARQPSSHSPPPPYNGGPRRITTGHGEVTLSVSECEIFNLLSSVDPNAAHWYIVDAISRAMATRAADAASAPVVSIPQAANDSGSSTSAALNPEANEFRATTICPLPGFGGD